MSYIQRFPRFLYLLTNRASDKQSSIKSQLDTIEAEAGKMSSSSAAELRTIREEVLRLLSSAEKSSGSSSPDPILGLSEQLSKLQIAAGTTERETRILQQLYFEEIFTREDTIGNASGGTFEWILAPEREPSEASSFNSDDDTEVDDDGGSVDLSDDNEVTSSAASNDHRPPDDVQIAAKSLLQGWLASGSGVFHISGKPGAGKSTLMKLLFNHPQTRKFLEEWAGDRELVLVPFFFWNSGRELQKSLQGLYRSLLFHVLTQCPALIPELFPDQWKRALSTTAANSSLDSTMFRAPIIKEAFDRLMETPISSDRLAFCFFIDGLDEYDAHAYDHRQLTVQLCRWAKQSNIKLCVSSRPHVEFTDTFPSELRIHLHELTGSDIQAFTCEMFESDPNFDRVRDVYFSLVSEVVKRAEGVFLWARLVLKTLLREVGLHSTYDRLLQKIRSLPREMDELYDRMLADLDDADRRRADLMLNIVRMYSCYWPLHAVCLTRLDDVTQPTFPSADHLSWISSRDNLRNGVEAVERQLSGLTKGLLQLTSGPLGAYIDDPIFLCHAVFFHRTARDYLDTPLRRKRFKETFPTLDPGDVLCRLGIANLAVFRSMPASAHMNNLPFIHMDPARIEYDDDVGFKQLKLETIQVMESNFDRSHRATFTHFSSLDFYNLRNAAGPEPSFLHYAAAFHQIQYVQEAINTSQDRRIPPVCEGVCADAQELSLIFSATLCQKNPEFLAMLLDAGASTQCRLHLFGMHPEEDRLVRVDRTMSFWMAFLARLGFYPRSTRLGMEDPDYLQSIEREFETMELILRAHQQPEVMMLVCCSGKPYFMTLSELVRAHEPANMDRLLKLLPPDSGDWHSWLHVREFLASLESIHPEEAAHQGFHLPRLPGDYPEIPTSELRLRKNQRIALVSEDDMYVLTDDLYIRLW